MNTTLFDGFLYGLIQGVTEYLPVSSSAHLLLLPRFLGKEDPGLAFDVFLHIGTLIATVGFFWRDWWNCLRPRAWAVAAKDFRAHGITIPNLVVGTIPAVICALLFEKAIKGALRGELVVAVTLTIGGVLLWASDRFAKANREANLLTMKDAFIIGCFQCLALVPGMSRSGSTMSGARLIGFSRAASARISFLLSAPITFGAILFEVRHFSEFLDGSQDLVPVLLAGVSSLVFGVATIGFLLRMLKKISFSAFAVYRIALAVVVYFMFVA